jgi:hypothetical protein
MGFKWRKCQSKHKILIERADIVEWRSKYLMKMKQYWEEGCPILYVDESWVDSNLTFRKCWQSDDVMGIQVNVNSRNSLIMLHAGGINSFVPNAQFVYKTGSATGDYHGRMNSANFGKWVVEKLVPYLPPYAVIVLGNTPYHCIQPDKPPSAYTRRRDIISWLHNGGVNCSVTMCKDSPYRLIVLLKPKKKAFEIDSILSEYGHTAVQLPPYMCNLNPIELTRAIIKRIVREHSVTVDLSLQKLLQMTNDAIGQVTQENWKGFCQHVESVEKQYWEKGGIVPDVLALSSASVLTVRVRAALLPMKI